MCMFLKLISHYGPLSLFSMDNGQPFASEQLAHILKCHHIENSTSSPYFPRCNGFTECQVWTLKITPSTGQDSHKTIKDILLDLWSTPIRPNMTSPHKILHNRMLQCPGKPSQPVDTGSEELPPLPQAVSEDILWHSSWHLWPHWARSRAGSTPQVTG